MCAVTNLTRDPLTHEQEQFLRTHIKDEREAEVFQNFSSRYRDIYRITTDEQREVVRCLEGPVFVSAGAGTGKTETLTRRVIYALTEGSAGPRKAFLQSLDEALIITFTNDAANTIKERLRAALYANNMRTYAHEVDNAWISTIHGMCSRIIRENALELNVDPNFGTLEADRSDGFIQDAATEAIDRALKAEYGFDNDQDRLRGFIREYGHKEGSSVGISCDSMVADLLKKSAENAGGLDSVVYAFPDGSFGPADAFDDTKFPTLQAENTSKLDTRFLEVARYAPVLHKLALFANELYCERKDREALLDYADLLRVAHAALSSNESVRSLLRDKFHLIMVDEFQDTSQIQIDTITELAGPGKKYLATVGDAQQSIYRFRGADVGVFKASRDDAANKKLTLTKNFRSHQEILNFVEHVCKGNRMISEDEFLHLHAGFGDEHFHASFQETSLPRIYVEAEGTSRNLEMSRKAVAALIADRLAAIHKKQGIPLSDMTLLMSSLTNADIYVDALRERGLEAVMAKGSIFHELDEVGVINALLISLANPNDTESGLIPLLASPMFMLSDDDFYSLSATNINSTQHATLWDKLCAPATAGESNVLKHARKVFAHANESLPQLAPAELCRQMIDDSGWLKRLCEQGETEQELAAECSVQLANIMRALDIIRMLSAERGWGYAKLAQEFKDYLEKAKIGPAQLSGSTLEAVRIMTIHGSKGLEFPVVAMAEFYAAGPDKGRLSIARNEDTLYACLAPLELQKKELEQAKISSYLGEHKSITSNYRYLRQREELEELEEDARKIYVCLTRAQEALVVGMAFGKDAFKVGSRNEWALRAITHEKAHDFERAEEPFNTRWEEKELDFSAHLRCACVLQEEDDTYISVKSDTTESEAAIKTAFAAACEQSSSAEDEESVESTQDNSLYAMDPAFKERRPLQTDTSYSFSSASMQVDSKHASKSHLSKQKADNPDEAPEEIAVDEDREEGLSRGKRATNFGSAVHAGCELMVRLGLSADESLSPERIAALARTWLLQAGSTSDKKGADDLDAALRLWSNSSIRKELLEWGELIEAEVPFFVEAPSCFGEYMDGYIDLLVSDKERKCARVLDYKTGYLDTSETAFQEAHEMQANFYAYALLNQGYERVECDFLAVQVKNEKGDALRAHYGPFSPENLPKLYWD